MRIEIPDLCVVAMIGASGSGKTTLAKRLFKETEVLSSDRYRALVSDDETNQLVSSAAFDALYYMANARLRLGRLTVIDATNVQKDARAEVLRLAKEQDVHAAAIVLNLPEKLCQSRNDSRTDRTVGAQVIGRQSRQLRQSLKSLRKEGFRYVYVLSTEEEVAAAEVVRTPLYNNKKDQTGPFDIIGDVHGCYEELCDLLERLGYVVDQGSCTAVAPAGRRAIFLGDLCDRGPKNVEVLRLVMNMVRDGTALAVPGNHDTKLLRQLRGKQVQMSHGLDRTVGQVAAQDEAFIAEVATFIQGLTSHYVLDGGRLVVAHAGLKEAYHGRSSGRVRAFCLYGDTTGETDEYGLPVRLPWANDYRGQAMVVYGHTAIPEVQVVNNTYCIDTGCVYGGKLTALRYPEREIIQVDAKQQYYEPARPLAAPQDRGDTLNIDDVLNRDHLTTRLRTAIKIRPENAAAALEAMSRFAADPHWLVYLPPTMSPCETSTLSDYLEHPVEAFDYYGKRGVRRVVCEQKHMGSRAVIVVCRDAEAAARRFGVSDGRPGIIYTRTGRHFFSDLALESGILARLQAALLASNFWTDFDTDWACFDTELMPWSAKAQELLERQYAPVGRSGRNGLAAAVASIRQAVAVLGDQGAAAGVNLQEVLQRYEARAEALTAYTQAYRRYCWDIDGIDDYRIAPFHVLATEGKVWSDKDHLWHLGTIDKYVTATDPLFTATAHLVVDTQDPESVAAGIRWWEELTAAGGEGMVVKPYDFIAVHGQELLQPAVKCRGREYLRIIYGPEYLLADNLPRLKSRSLGRKRSLALSEFALGMESLERFVQKEPLYRVHECVFGVLALESEPVDARL